MQRSEASSKGPIAAMFWQNEEYASDLGKDIYLDGVVCVVDAVFGEQVGRQSHCQKNILNFSVF